MEGLLGCAIVAVIFRSRWGGNQDPRTQLHKETSIEGDIGDNKFRASDTLCNRAVDIFFSKALVIEVSGDKAVLFRRQDLWAPRRE
ncbi:hypothetical protein HO133_000167 [Letharia lupina]|uniref:Uncharacterized protein n=1 Tax=Letharia lupina TaxID=560253 RepID=A0A8H6FCJ0_9LECA|nr:uncharacterized protein HO133_000167 [Letharia lupina]KAF6223325.1 hypothetical protein HO133_000167 [Letharia lupina]